MLALQEAAHQVRPDKAPVQSLRQDWGGLRLQRSPPEMEHAAHDQGSGHLPDRYQRRAARVLSGFRRTSRPGLLPPPPVATSHDGPGTLRSPNLTGPRASSRTSRGVRHCGCAPGSPGRKEQPQSSPHEATRVSRGRTW